MAHIPVLLDEMFSNLKPIENGLYIDATFGGGGYTRKILDQTTARVVAFDKDPAAIERAQVFQHQYGQRFHIIHDSFCHIAQHVHEKVNGIVFDFGVSSFQLDEAERGFSFQKEGPLDMRMSQQGLSAKDVVNTYEENDLADIFYHYGDEKKSRVIARQIVKKRQEKLFETTSDLASLVQQIVKRKDGIDPATRTFQALRIFVNNELIEIRDALENALHILSPGSILMGVTFHSLEDRLLKNFFKNHRFSYASKVIIPSQKEIMANPRSRSAKMRFGIWGGD